MGDEKKTRDTNPLIETLNWEQRVKTELEAPHKWNEAWGTYFCNDVPMEYESRVKYFSEELKKFPQSSIHPPKYGVGQPFMTLDPDRRRKKLNSDPFSSDSTA